MNILELFKKKESANVAKNRMKMLLVADRASCSPEVMEKIKNDIINVISKYMDVDRETLDISITTTDNGDGTSPTLFANIPIKELKSRSTQ